MTRSREKIEEIVNRFGYFLLDEYIPEKGKSRRVIIQDNIGYKYDVQLGSLMQGYIPYFISRNNPFSLYNLSLWLNINNKPFYLVEGNIYYNKKTKLNFYCNNCNLIFSTHWDTISQGTGCPFCAIKNNNDSKRKSSEKFVKEVYDIVEMEYSVIGEYKGAHIYVEIRHNVCGHIWEIYPSAFLRGNRCPKCKSSKGEVRVRRFLDKDDIKYIFQHTFDDCFYKRILYFDFYLPEYNLCIEYDGILHFEDKFDNPKEFKLTQKRDKIKTKYCKDNKVKLLRIPYWEFDNIETILERTLFD